MILVTGSEGFIGSRVCAELAHRTEAVTTLDRSGRADLVMDLLDLGHPADVDAVIHLAAKADISRNWDSHTERVELYQDNLLATIQLLEAVGPRCKRFVFVSTAACADGSRSPYVASKLAGEALVQAYAHRHGWAWECVRLVSCVGPGYHHGHIADFVRMAREGVVRARSNGEIRNPFVHVDDAANALCDAVAAPRNRVTYVAGERWSWRDTVEVMRELGESFDVQAPPYREGWIGDPELAAVTSDYVTERSVKEGVVQAIRGLR